MYRPRFLGLDEAAHLIARLLRTARPNDYPDDCSALDEGRRELVQALFDGTVRSQGVLYELPPLPPPDQDGPFPVPSPDKWLPIEAGWWSNRRYEKLAPTKPDSTEDFGFELEPQASPLEVGADHPAVMENEGSSSHEDTASSRSPVKHQLDKGVVNWSDDGYEIDENYNTDWFYGGIQIWRADIEALFHISVGEEQPTNTPNDSQQRLQPLPPRGELKRPTSDKKKEMHEFLLAKPPKSMTREEMIQDVRQHFEVSRDDARTVVSGLPQDHRLTRGEKKGPTK